MYDAIVVGARCGGSPAAMLLAEKGYSVLLVDKSTFPSDIMSTHYVHVPGVLRLERWGLLDRLLATNCPKLHTMTLHLNGVAFTPPPFPIENPPPEVFAVCPRRTVLDKLLVDRAAEAGVEVREGFSVKELVWNDGAVAGIRGSAKGGSEVTEDARLVIGADGLHSTVAREVKPAEYNTKPSLSYGYYNYWSGIPLDGAEIHMQADTGGLLAFPTNDGLTCIAVGGPIDSFHEFRKDIPGNYMKMLAIAPELEKMAKAAKAEERYVGTADQPNYFRKPYGPGWALVGDAGYHRDFVTGLGITDAFRDAEYLTDAVDEAFSGRRPFDDAMAGYERRRNEIAEPLYEVTTKMVSGGEITPELFLQFGIAMAKMVPAAVEA